MSKKKSNAEIVLDRRDYLTELVETIETVPRLKTSLSKEKIDSIQEELTEFNKAAENVKKRNPEVYKKWYND